MSTTLAERKAAALERLMAVDSARRGQLSAQYYTRKAADGRSTRQGPYYVWQRSVKGQKRSVRVSGEQIERVQAELERGREVQAILDEVWMVLEQTAIASDPHAKKKPMRSRRPATAKPKPRSNSSAGRSSPAR
jgi:hypothetical protein